MSRREKIMITLLLVVAVAYLFYQFILNPNLNELSKLREESRDLKVKVSRTENLDKNLQIKESSIEKAKEELIESSDRMLRGFQQEHVGMILEEVIQQSNIDVFDVSISSVVPENISLDSRSVKGRSLTTLESDFEEFYGKKDEETLLKKDDKHITSPVMDVKVNIQGKYEEIMRFVKNLESNPKKFLLKSIGLNSGRDKGLFGCNLSMKVFIMPGECEFDKGEFEKESMRDNPFASIGEFQKKLSFLERTPDVYMQLKPTSSDVSTMIMGSYNGGARERIHIDSEKVIEGKIVLKEEDGDLKIRYELGDAWYPKEEEAFASLRLNDDGVIFMEIQSSRRNNGDSNGVQMIIENTTDFEFLYRVVGDDKGNPRFKLIDTKGNVREAK